MSRCPRLHHWLLAATVIAFGCLAAAAASAAPLLVLGQDGRAQWRDDPFLRGPADTPIPDAGRPGHKRERARVARSGGRTVSSELLRLLRTHQITPNDYAGYQASLRSAVAAVKRMSGTRAAELQAVIQNLHSIAAGGMLTPSRLPALFLTLDRNRSWWTTGPLLAPGQRVSFRKSQIVWEYYPGQGIELQELGSFGQADWMYHAGPKYFNRLRALVDELIPLAAHRGGGLAWEYYFQFDGGAPPWISAMSQGTAIQALTQTSEALHDPAYMGLARRALPVFAERPPLGVARRTALGRRYLLYSFAPDAAVINGFLQSLIGLYDYAKASNDPQGARLFEMGDAEARAELPSYDTGAWSLYQPGEESSLDYHTLVIQFLQQLCSRTRAQVYCTTARRFQSYLKTPPALKLLTARLPARTSASVWFRVSKVSRVGITIKRGSDTLFVTSAEFSYGAHSFSVPALRRGQVTVQLDATDLAGNYSQTSTEAQVGR